MANYQISRAAIVDELLTDDSMALSAIVNAAPIDVADSEFLHAVQRYHRTPSATTLAHVLICVGAILKRRANVRLF